jgi:hypothetical protein
LPSSGAGPFLYISLLMQLLSTGIPFSIADFLLLWFVDVPEPTHGFHTFETPEPVERRLRRWIKIHVIIDDGF